MASRPGPQRGPPRRPRMGKFVLKLYIAGSSPRSQRAIANLQLICAEQLPGSELEVIDVLEQPHLAEGARIMATPTLIKELPPPVRRIIGDLSDAQQVLLGLDLQRKPNALEESGVRGQESGKVRTPPLTPD